MKLHSSTPTSALVSASLVVLLALGASSVVLAWSQSPAPPAACGDAPSIQGSTWDVVEDTRPPRAKHEVALAFKPDSKLVEYTGPFRHGTWSQTGACVYLEVDEKDLEFKGVIKGARMEGTGQPKYGREFKWTLVQRSGRYASGGPVRRGFDPAGPDSLVRTGTGTYSRREEKQVGVFSFTRSRDGKISVPEPKTETKTVVKNLYDVSLYLDEAGALKALERFDAENLGGLLRVEDIHEAVLAGTFDRSVVLTFKESWPAKEIRQDFVEKLGARTSLDDPALGDFLKCIASDFKAGDEVVIRVSKAQALSVAAAASSCAEISSPSFSRAVLSIWIGKNTLSGESYGLLAEVAPLLKQ